MIIAVDTGGTKTLIEAFDKDGVKTHIARFPTPRDTDEYIASIHDAVVSHAGASTIDALAVAVPGPIIENALKHAPNLGWVNFDVVAALREHFPSSIVLLGNDADIAGLAEARALEPVPSKCLYVTLSTGVGTGLTLQSKLSLELGRFEGGSMRFMYDGTLQRWEAFASGKNFLERTGKLGRDEDDPAVWQDYADRIAVGLNVLIPLLGPGSIVIGGSMGTHFAKYEQFLRSTLEESIPQHMSRTTLSQAKHPEEAVIYGCYYYAVDALTAQAA